MLEGTCFLIIQTVPESRKVEKSMDIGHQLGPLGISLILHTRVTLRKVCQP